jgi:hypothetical protein
MKDKESQSDKLTVDDLRNHINWALMGWQAGRRNVAAYDRLHIVVLRVVGGRYEPDIDLQKLVEVIEEGKGKPFNGSAPEFQARWDDRRKGFVERLEEIIDSTRV